MTEQMQEPEIEEPIEAEDTTAEVIDYSRAPTKEDGDDYWKGFATENGWKPDPEAAPAGEFKDFKAFVRFHDKYSEVKDLKSSIDDMRKDMDKVARSQGEYGALLTAQHEKDLANLRATLEKQKSEAEETSDIEAYKSADQGLKELEDKAPKQEEAKEPEVITSFRQKNPEILHGSDSFDVELADAVASSFNYAFNAGKLNSEAEVSAFLEQAIKFEKASMPKYNKPVRKAIATNQTTNRRQAKGLSPESLDPASKKWYNQMIEDKQTTRAEAFLEGILGTK